jgi:hypothetical protein
VFVAGLKADRVDRDNVILVVEVHEPPWARVVGLHGCGFRVVGMPGVGLCALHSGFWTFCTIVEPRSECVALLDPSARDLVCVLPSIGLLVSGFGFWVSGFGFQVSGFGFRVWGLGFGVSSFGFRFSGFGFRVSGFGFWCTSVAPTPSRSDRRIGGLKL